MILSQFPHKSHKQNEQEATNYGHPNGPRVCYLEKSSPSPSWDSIIHFGLPFQPVPHHPTKRLQVPLARVSCGKAGCCTGTPLGSIEVPPAQPYKHSPSKTWVSPSKQPQGGQRASLGREDSERTSCFWGQVIRLCQRPEIVGQPANMLGKILHPRVHVEIKQTWRGRGSLEWAEAQKLPAIPGMRKSAKDCILRAATRPQL